MKTIIIFIILLFFSNSLLYGQNRTVYGRIVQENLDVAPYIRIQTPDKAVVGSTDKDGKFKIEIPQNTNALIFSYLGEETTTIRLSNDCDTVELVMMDLVTYDFISLRKVDKLRLKRYNKLPELYLQAYKKGVFTKQEACYNREFDSHKPKPDSIEKKQIKIKKDIKLTFKRLSIGDTIRIPFSGTYRADGTDRTSLTVYSAFTDIKNFDCVIKCVILDKDTHKRGYNLTCKVVDYIACKSPAIFDNKVMKSGEMLTYNMRYFKVLDDK